MAANNNELSTMKNPKRKAGFRDILHILTRYDVDIDSFAQSMRVKQALLVRQRVFTITKIARKGLLKSAQTIACVGSNLETSLNVLSNKTNFVVFLKNLTQGKIAGPRKDSSSYLTLIGLLDGRMDLDKNSEPGSDRYFASISVMASKLAYENHAVIKNTVERRWNMKLLGSGAYNFWDEKNKDYSTQAFIFHDDTNGSDTVFVAFRGTEAFNAYDWCTDFEISWRKLEGNSGKVHDGFMKALGQKTDGTWPTFDSDGRKRAYPTITEILKARLRTSTSTKFVVTGHSLGGALAALYPSVLAAQGETKVLEQLESVYTFGQPRVGDEMFARFMTGTFERFGIRFRRFVYNNDIIPRMPYDDLALRFRHFGMCVYVDSNYEAKAVKEVPYKNFPDPFVYAPMVVDASWQLVRSFLLPKMFGREFKEGILQRIARVGALVIPSPIVPGMVDHGLQDYINAIKLADY